MPRLTFYPLGNADTCLMTLDKKKLLFDFAAMRDPLDKNDARIDLPSALRDDLDWPNCREFDVVAFTHLDDDHIRGSSDFFFLEHAAKYQDGDRVKIRELWVPAAAIVEDGIEDEARIIRQEARHRLKAGKGIRVFSRPAKLADWLAAQGLTVEDRRSLITDAGELVPGFSKESDGVEFFVHSPYGERDNEVVLDRNENSLVFQAAFRLGDTRFLMAADTTWENWDKIVRISRLHKNTDRLTWDIFKLPHHCSYLSLSDDKGETETVPVPNMQWLLEQARSRAIVVSPSWPIDDVDQDQPPHFQAKNRYKRVLEPKIGRFMVTMEYPSRVSPKRIMIEITAGGANLTTVSAVAGTGLLEVKAPRVG